MSVSAASPNLGMNGSLALPARGDGRPTRTAAQIAQQVDVLALTVGTKLSASALLLAGVIVILLGAQSLLGSLKSMDKDIAEMNKQMDVANSGLVVLNKTMTSVEPMANSMHAIVKTIDA